MPIEAEVIEELVVSYQDADPKPETTAAIVRGLAEDYGLEVNQVKLLLKKEGVLVAAKIVSAPTKSDKPPRRLKVDCHNDLKAAIRAVGKDVDEDTIGRLTGKAADYFTGVIKND